MIESQICDSFFAFFAERRARFGAGDHTRKLVDSAKHHETGPGLQIRGSKFQSLNSNYRELELSSFLGLVLGCIEAKFCK